ncbi:hypothetical protein QTP88_011371 [Uroleucon formosanum]
MTNVLLETLKKYAILLDDMSGQGYDNGINMSVRPLEKQIDTDAIRAIRFQVKEIYSALLEISQDNSLVNFSCVKVVPKQLYLKKTLKSDKLLANALIIEDSFPFIDQSRITRTNTQFNYESRDDSIIDSKQRFKVNFFNAILDEVIQSINGRFLQLSEHANLFSFLYDISKIKNSYELMTHCKDIQLALASDDCLTSDINAVELYDEITALQRRFNDTETNPRIVLEYICENQLVELFPNTYISLRILLTLLVTVATEERSFSK